MRALSAELTAVAIGGAADKTQLYLGQAVQPLYDAGADLESAKADAAVADEANRSAEAEDAAGAKARADADEAQATAEQAEAEAAREQQAAEEAAAAAQTARVNATDEKIATIINPSLAAEHRARAAAYDAEAGELQNSANSHQAAADSHRVKADTFTRTAQNLHEVARGHIRVNALQMSRENDERIHATGKIKESAQSIDEALRAVENAKDEAEKAAGILAVKLSVDKPTNIPQGREALASSAKLPEQIDELQDKLKQLRTSMPTAHDGADTFAEAIGSTGAAAEMAETLRQQALTIIQKVLDTADIIAPPPEGPPYMIDVFLPGDGPTKFRNT